MLLTIYTGLTFNIYGISFPYNFHHIPLPMIVLACFFARKFFCQETIHVLFLVEILNLKYNLGMYCWHDFASRCLIQIKVVTILQIQLTKRTTYDVR